MMKKPNPITRALRMARYAPRLVRNQKRYTRKGRQSWRPKSFERVAVMLPPLSTLFPEVSSSREGAAVSRRCQRSGGLRVAGDEGLLHCGCVQPMCG